MKSIVQPGEGVAPLIRGISKAKKSVEIVIFRLNRRDLEKALTDAVTRGVHVHALIAHTNRGGELNLRELESRLLAAGVTVSRTDTDLVRYHSKLMIIDRRVLYLLAFNFTYLDIERSRSFGVVTTNKKHVQEAVKLFEADTRRQPLVPCSATFLVSPLNARKQLATFIKGAKKELLIYDPEISDPAMIKLLEARSRAGVTINIIGRLTAKNTILQEPESLQIRLHTRSILRDGTWAFVGSQSLRALELDSRREVGIIFRDPKVVSRFVKVFKEDWESGGAANLKKATADEVAAEDTASAAEVARKVAKAVAKELGPVTPVVSNAVPDVHLNEEEIEATVRTAVKNAVNQAVRDFVEEAVEVQNGVSKK